MRFITQTTLFLFLVLLIGANESAVARSPNASPFMATTGKTTQPIGHHDFCMRHASECKANAKGGQRVKLTPEAWNMLVEVNDTVNAMIKPETDQDLFGKAEVWAYPTEAGDCEDFALLKRRMLAERGWPIGGLLITVVRQSSGDGHAVLTVLTDRGDLVLDNLEGEINLWNGTPYRFLKRQSTANAGEWVSIDDGRAAVVGSLRK